MKKIIFLLSTLIFINASNAFAIPVNHLENQQIAIGIMGGNITNTYYFENKISNNVTVGIQYIDSDVDCYGQLDFSNNSNPNSTLKLIIGSRNLESKSTTYLGAAVSVPLTDEFGSYAVGLIGENLKELQLGVVNKLTDSISINLNYRIVKHNGTKDGIGLGLDCRI